MADKRTEEELLEFGILTIGRTALIRLGDFAVGGEDHVKQVETERNHLRRALEWLASEVADICSGTPDDDAQAWTDTALAATEEE